MNYNRRSILSMLGVSLPFGIRVPESRAAQTTVSSVTLQTRPFEEAVRDAFADLGHRPGDAESPIRRVEVGHSEPIRSGVQGCCNDRPFAGFPTGHLRIVRTGTGPGPVRHGLRFYEATVDVTLTRGEQPGRPLDFGSLPPAARLSASVDDIG